MIKLTSEQLEVLADIDLDARASVVDVAKRLRMKSHTVRYVIDRLGKTLGLEANTWTHPYLQGHTPHRIYFSVQAKSREKIGKLVHYLKNLPEVHWIASLVGYYQYGMTLRSSSVGDFVESLDKIDREFGDLFVQKTLGILVQVAFFPMKLFYRQVPKSKYLEYKATAARVELDVTDKKLLSALSLTPTASLSDLAKQLKLPLTTLSYRFEKLEKSGVLIGFFYTLDERLIGLERFLVLVSLEGLGARYHERFYEFAKKHPNVVVFTYAIGSWDFEFKVVYPNSTNLPDFIHEIYTCGEGAVREVLVHAWGQDYKG